MPEPARRQEWVFQLPERERHARYSDVQKDARRPVLPILSSQFSIDSLIRGDAVLGVRDG